MLNLIHTVGGSLFFCSLAVFFGLLLGALLLSLRNPQQNQDDSSRQPEASASPRKKWTAIFNPAAGGQMGAANPSKIFRWKWFWLAVALNVAVVAMKNHQSHLSLERPDSGQTVPFLAQEKPAAVKTSFSPDAANNLLSSNSAADNTNFLLGKSTDDATNNAVSSKPLLETAAANPLDTDAHADIMATLLANKPSVLSGGVKYRGK
jgi:hypothetical protein